MYTNNDNDMGMRMEYSIGKMLSELRRSKHISLEKLSRGLCSTATLCRYERGERLPDILTMRTLFARLGKSVDKIGAIISQEEYEYLLLRWEALDCAEQKNEERMGQIVSTLENSVFSINENLQKQFILVLKAFDANQKNKEKTCIEYLKNALEITLPKFSFQNFDEILLGEEELQIMLVLAEMYIKIGEWDIAGNILSESERYIDQHYDDKDHQVKVYPKTIRLYTQILIKNGKYMECMILCEKAITLLREMGVLFDLVELMEAYVKCQEQGIYTEQGEQYRVWMQVLRESYEEADCVQGMDNTWRHYQNQELNLIHELLGQCRRRKGLTQEEASEGICTPETLSRIEHAKREPIREHVQALMKKYDRKVEFYEPALNVLDFHILEMNKQLDRLIDAQKWEEAEVLLDTIKTKLSEEQMLQEEHNQKTVRLNEACIRYNLGKLDVDSFLKTCEELLEFGREGWRKEEFWTVTLKGYHAETLNCLAMIYWKKGELEKSAYIWEHMLEWLKRSNIRYEERYAMSTTAIGNLCYSYGIFGRNEECVHMCDMGIALCIKTGRGNRYAQFWGDKGETLEVVYGISPYTRKLINRARMISQIFNTDNDVEYYDTYIKEHY